MVQDQKNNKTFDEIQKGYSSVPQGSPINSPIRSLRTSVGGTKVRRQLKPVVLTNIIPDMPEDLRGTYRKYLEQNKKDMLKYVNAEDNKPMKNIFQQMGSNKLIIGYPKLKPFIQNEKGKPQLLKMNEDSILPKTRTFKFERKRTKHLHLQRDSKLRSVIDS